MFRDFESFVREGSKYPFFSQRAKLDPIVFCILRQGPLGGHFFLPIELNAESLVAYGYSSTLGIWEMENLTNILRSKGRHSLSSDSYKIVEVELLPFSKARKRLTFL